jgi:excisionase family DNA binding protein
MALKVKPRELTARGAFTILARPTGFEPVAFGFVEDIHVSSNSCRDVQACANTGSVSDEKSKNVQIHASLSKEFAGSLLDGMAMDSEVLRFGRPLLSVRQVAKLLGVCPATVYRLCDRGELPQFRVLNAIRVDPRDLKEFMARARKTPSARHRLRGRVRRAASLVAKRPESDYSP